MSNENRIIEMVTSTHSAIVEDFTFNSDEEAYEFIKLLRLKMDTMLNDLDIVSEDGETYVE